jgi:hypothetical protein
MSFARSSGVSNCPPGCRGGTLMLGKPSAVVAGTDGGSPATGAVPVGGVVAGGVVAGGVVAGGFGMTGAANKGGDGSGLAATTGAGVTPGVGVTTSVVADGVDAAVGGELGDGGVARLPSV